MGFPKTILGFPIDWKKLGKGGYYTKENKSVYEVCQFCKKRIKIGKENNKIFKYCPRCMLKKDN